MTRRSRRSGRQWGTLGRRLVVGMTALATMGASHVRASVTAAPAAAAAGAATSATQSEPASASAAMEPSSVPMYLMVHVDLGDSDAEVEPVVRKRVRERLHALGLREQRGAARELTVTVRWADAGADAAGSESYAVDYAFVTLADEAPRKLGSEVCDRCGMGELLAMLDRDIAKLRPELVAPVEVPAPTVAAEPPEPSRKRRAAPLSTLGKVGIGVSAAGALGVIVGGILLGTPDKSRVDPNNPAQLEIKRYGESGAAFLAVGLGVLVAGVVMLAVDRARARRRR